MNDKAQAKIQALRERYAKELPQKLVAIEQIWQDIHKNFTKEKLQNLYNEIHKLSGTSGTYGFFALNQISRDLEIYLKQLLDYQKINATHKSEVAHLIEQMKDTQVQTESVYSLEPQPHFHVSQKLIFYFIAKHERIKQDLKDNLTDLGYQIILFRSLADFNPHDQAQLPAVLMIDEEFLVDTKIKQLGNFRKRYQIPLICLAKHDDLNTRLKAVRAGVSIFFRKPINIFYLTNRIIQLCDLSAKENYRILILDDSHFLADYYAIILKEAGMSVRTISSPLVLIQELQTFKPNLLLLDLYLPGCNGYELSKVIRAEEEYAGLPIVFISTEDDRIKQLSIISSCGADDFLTKPVLPQNLIAAVKSRAQRAALLNSFIIHDHLTQLLNHTYFLKEVEFELLRAQRLKQSVAVAMIDIDNFKNINDQYGHPAGDLILKKIAEFLTKKIRKIDIIGRYGGEEFAIIFPNTTLSNAINICNNLAKKLRQYPFEIDDKEIYLTLSIGVADYPRFKTVENLIAAADQALYQAKSSGKNKVEPS